MNMMVLGAFALVNPRWRPSNIVYKEYENYVQLTQFLPKDIFEARMKTITRLVLKEFPHVCLDSHLFVLALALVIAAAVFAIAARALSIAMWYPLCILIIPAMIAYWTTRRRGLYFIKISQFHDKLEECLKSLTIMDAAYQIRWSYRRLELTDSGESLGLKSALDNHAVTLVIEITQMRYSNCIDLCTRRNYNGERQQRVADVLLPTYESIERDIVLDIGPPAMEEVIITSPPPVYTSSSRQHELSPLSTIIMTANSHTLPPPYHCYQQHLNII